jgi:hypothetical protein
MFTQRAGLLGFVAFCFYLIAVVNSLPGFYYLLSWMSLGLLAASLGIAFLSLIGLDCQWRLSQNRGYASWNIDDAESETGEVPSLQLSLRYTGTLNKTGILLEIQFKTAGAGSGVSGPGLSGKKRRKSKTAPIEVTSHRYLLEAVPSGSTIDVSLPLYHLPRGRHEIVQLMLLGSDVLGLFRVRRRLMTTTEEKPEFVVGPPLLLDSSTAHAAGRGRLETGSHRVLRFGVGDEVRGTRPYVSGDDLRHVHWKSTARAGELVVREWEHTGHSAVLVVWDGARGTTWGPSRFDSTEIGLSLTASLCATLGRASIPCALACLGENPVYIEPEPRSSGQALSDAQFETLAVARAARTGSAGAALEIASRGRSHDYDLVFWITSSLAPTLPAVIRQQGVSVNTRLALVDGAQLRQWASDSRSGKNAVEPVDGMNQFDGPKPSGGASQSNGVNQPKRGGAVAGIPVSLESYQAQEQALREVGAFVVTVAPRNPAEVTSSVRRALEALLDSV